MADDFDVEAMLEAPYRKVGCRLQQRGLCVGFFYCYDLLLSPFYICYCDKVYLNVLWCD